MTVPSLKIVFHGQNAANFRQGFEQLISPQHQVLDLSDALDQAGERAHYETADVIVGIKLDAAMPQPKAVRLYHAPGAGTDAIDAALLPAQSAPAAVSRQDHCIAASSGAKYQKSSAFSVDGSPSSWPASAYHSISAAAASRPPPFGS